MTSEAVLCNRGDGLPVFADGMCEAHSTERDRMDEARTDLLLEDDEEQE